MFNTLITINYLAVLVVAVIRMVLGFLWYSNILFGKKWAQLSGSKPDQMKKEGMMMTMLIGFIASWVMSYFVAGIISLADVSTIQSGAMIGFVLWLGFIATVLINSMLYEGKTIKFYLINSGYYLVALLISGAILAIWR